MPRFCNNISDMAKQVNVGLARTLVEVAPNAPPVAASRPQEQRIQHLARAEVRNAAEACRLQQASTATTPLFPPSAEKALCRQVRTRIC